jgi:UDPglucose 6-dehydrogenase
MNKKVAIIGFGKVGQEMYNIFQNKDGVLIYDKGDKQSDGKKAINTCGLAIVCVPTPKSKSGEADISAVEEVVKWLNTDLILIKSTVPPGTTDYLSKKYGKRICFSPEYVGESRYHMNYKYPHPEDARSHTFFNIGGKPKDTSAVWEYFKDEMCVDTRVGFGTAKEAELAKYMENAFFATKVTFCNEFADICEAHNVEYDRVREMWLNDPRINPMHTAVFAESRGFGGKCYPKDVHAIVHAAKKKKANPILLQAVIDKNSTYD